MAEDPEEVARVEAKKNLEAYLKSLKASVSNAGGLGAKLTDEEKKASEEALDAAEKWLSDKANSKAGEADLKGQMEVVDQICAPFVRRAVEAYVEAAEVKMSDEAMTKKISQSEKKLVSNTCRATRSFLSDKPNAEVALLVAKLSEITGVCDDILEQCHVDAAVPKWMASHPVALGQKDQVKSWPEEYIIPRGADPTPDCQPQPPTSTSEYKIL